MSLASIKTCTFAQFPSPLRVVNEQYIVAMDLMKSITRDQNQAAAILRNLSGDLFPQSKFIIMALPGQGNSKTKLVTFNDAALLVMVAPGKAAMKLRQTFAEILTRVAAGDVSLISAIVANAKSSHPVALMARSSLSSAEPSSATISEQPAQLAIKSSPSGSPGPASGAMFEDVPAPAPPRKSHFEEMMGEMPAPAYDNAVERNILVSERARLRGVFANLKASFQQRTAMMQKKGQELNARAQELEVVAQKNEKAGLALEQHNQALDDREAKLNKLEADLQARMQALDTREVKLNRFEADLQAHKQALDSREAKLNKLAADLETETIAVRLREDALAARAADDIRDADFNDDRSKELDAREDELGARAKELDAHAERLAAEKKRISIADRENDAFWNECAEKHAVKSKKLDAREEEIDARARELETEKGLLDARAEEIDARARELEAEKRRLERRQEQAVEVLIQNAAKSEDEIKEKRQEVEARAKALDLQAKELNECSEQLDARKADLDKRETDLHKRETEQMQYSGAVVVSSPIRKRAREADFSRVTQAAEEWAKISKIGDLSEDAKRMFQERLLGFLETE